MLQSYDTNGLGLSTNVNSSANCAAPSAVTVGSLSSSLQYASDLLPTQPTGPKMETRLGCDGLRFLCAADVDHCEDWGGYLFQLHSDGGDYFHESEY